MVFSKSSAVSTKVSQYIDKGAVKTIVLAGGFGKRLGIACDDKINRWAYPKPSLTVGSRRIIDFSIGAANEMGIRKMVFATYYLKESIEFLAKNRARELEISTECVEETEPRDTAGACKFIIENKGWYKGDNQIIILSADIIHNLDLINPFQCHLEKNASATIVVNPVPWADMYRFGSVRLEGMPGREEFKTDEEFKERVSEWVTKNLGSMKKIVQFREKRPSSFEEFMSLKDTNLKEAVALNEIYRNLEKKYKDEKKENRRQSIEKEIRKFHLALSTLNNSSIYITSSHLWHTFLPFITFKETPNPFSDFGGHIFPALTAQKEEDIMGFPLSQELRREILAGEFPFYAYIMPDKNNHDKQSYWVDAGVTSQLLKVNQDVLRGLIYVGLGVDTRFERDNKNKAWTGYNTYIAEGAQIVPLREGANEHEISSIVGHDVVIEKGARVEGSVIGSFVEIGKNVKIKNSVVMSPHFKKREEKGQVIIGDGAEITDSIVVGADIEPDKKYYRQVIVEPLGGVVTEEI